MKKMTALLIIWVLTSPCMSISIPEEIRTKASQCGINSLYLCMRYLSINLNLDQMYSDIERDEKNEVNLYQLTGYANKCGVAVKPIKHPTFRVINKYLVSNSCAIIQYKYPENQPHIAALLRHQDNKVLFCDYPRKIFIISEKNLCNVLIHSQGMLILSRTPFKKPIFSQLNRTKFLWYSLLIIALGIFATTVPTIRQKVRKKLCKSD